jgi:hypothetical protein
MEEATYSHDFDGRRFQLSLSREDDHRLEVIELGVRVAFALAQENESSPVARRFILADRFVMTVA